MRIGELLVEQYGLRPADVHRVVGEQSHAGQRLCSLLVARGLISFDDASRALSAQKRVPCALEKHLDGRLAELASLIPATLGRENCALPIGKTRGGELIVCVRDPSPQLLAALEQAAKQPVMMVVALASKLETLVAAAYGGSSDDFEVELGSVPATPPLPNMDMLDPASMRLALTALDDARVEKDPSQSGQLVAALARAATPPVVAPRATLPPTAPTLEQTRLALSRADTRDSATDLVVSYIAGRWVAGLVLALRGTAAIGYRGHGIERVDAIAMSLAVPSTVARAIETRKTATVAPPGEAQAQLARMLGQPPQVTAAPVLVDGHVVAVIAVGLPIQGVTDIDDATSALGHLAHALGVAYARILHA